MRHIINYFFYKNHNFPIKIIGLKGFQFFNTIFKTVSNQLSPFVYTFFFDTLSHTHMARNRFNDYPFEIQNSKQGYCRLGIIVSIVLLSLNTVI